MIVLPTGGIPVKTKKEIMKLSARNILKGKIKSVKKGPISSVVVLEIAPGVEIVSSITSESSGALKLKKGQAAYAVIKSSSVLVGVDE
jgi:molybdopterin-binding protein